MKQFYRPLTVLLSAALMLSLVSCGSPKAEPAPTQDPAEEPAQQTLEAESTTEDTRRTAYLSALERFAKEGTLPDKSRQLTEEEVFSTFQECVRYAIADVDSDSVEELIFVIGDAPMVAMTEMVYQYDPDTDSWHVELWDFPGVSYYDNGTVSAIWSHNQGLGGDFWPYTASRYNAETDTYEPAYYVDGWQKEYFETDFEGNPYPEDIDTEGAGFVYFLSPADDPEQKEILSQSQYDAWYADFFGNGNLIQLELTSLG